MSINFGEDFENNKVLNFYIKNPKVALDIDEVIADFVGGYKDLHPENKNRDIFNWSFSYKTKEILDELKTNKDFWLNLKPKINYLELPFIPHCYISKRNFSIDWTMEWLEKNHFPCVDVIHVEESKVQAFKESGAEYFVDDSFKNFQEMNANKCNTFLMDTPQNRQFEVGEYRLYRLQDIIQKL